MLTPDRSVEESFGVRLKSVGIGINSMKKISPTPFRSRMPVLALSLLVLGLWLSGCATFPGHDLPSYTYVDLPPAPADKMCLVSTQTTTLTDEAREIIDTTFAMLEKSGYFLKAPEHCTPDDEERTDIKWVFRNDTPAVNFAAAFVSGFISGFTFTIVPAFARAEILMTVQFSKNGKLLKEYAYREHADTWMHLSMLFMMSAHSPSTAARDIYNRMTMNFLYDYSRDVQQPKRIAIDQ